jgi:hypothetical protein
MDIRPEEIEYKKRVGVWGNSPVIEVGLKGGLHLIFASKGGKFETLGAGPHRAVARHIAKKKSDDKIQWTELSKADHIEPEHFADVLPKYEQLTDALRSRQGL